MKEPIVWQDRFNIGVPSIDKEHQKLFTILNRIFDAVKDKSRSEWACQEGIKYFKNHAIKHFDEEEQYMLSVNYSGYEMHKRIHNNFRKNTLPALERELEKTKFSEEAVSHFLGVCAGWLLGHTLTEDQAITGKAVSTWTNLLPEEENAALSQVIIELLYDVFRMDAHLVSEHYGGEKFGKGIYYRLAYDSEQGGQEVYLIFEDRMVLNIIASIIDIKADKVNAMAINTIRYISQQFLENMRMRFPDVTECELVEENLLEYKHFKKVFQKGTPHCSLLFDTGSGYFAFCSVTPWADRVEIKNALRAENEMDKVDQYLAKMVSNKKNKILVVDDSSTIRQFLKGLLSKEYEVEMVDSGLAAFRSIILNKPDLILLDYDMPVCDGRQVLEMIRGEKEFADTSVIFLTGRGDVDSVSKVMSLNPEGYLLKTTRPEEIKKSIELFFKRKKKHTT